MGSHGTDTGLLVLIVGGLLVTALLAKAGLRRIGLPPLVAYLVLGVALRAADDSFGILTDEGSRVFAFLATLGVITLLFRVGLESDVPGLVHQLRSATVIWLGNVVFSAAAGYAAARYLLGFDAVSSVVVATAMTATSVGIPARVWQDADALDTKEGQRFLDVAELDDLSGVVFMALLFAVLPVLQQKDAGGVAPVVAREAGLFFLKIAAFSGACVLFSRYAEERCTRFIRRIETGPDPMLVVVGLGLLVAALAGLLGFSVAIGAFFAGLVFSRDPQCVKVDASFSPLYDLFAPFFFIGVGLELDPGLGLAAMSVGGVLLLAATAGKLLGSTGPASLFASRRAAVALGVSMTPRAEIAMLIMHRALGAGVVPPVAYAGMVFVAAGTCLAAPPVLAWMLRSAAER